MTTQDRHRLRASTLACAGAVVLTALAFALNWLPPVRERLPFLFFFGAVASTARLFGFAPAVVSIVLSALLAHLFFLDPAHEWTLTPADAFRLAAFCGISALIASIAKQKSAAETAFTRERRKSLQILESITDAFVAFNRDWCYTYVNEKAAQLIGRTRQELLGQNVWELFPDVLGTPFESQVKRAMRKGVPADFEFFRQAANAWVECHAFPTSDGLALYFRDVSEKRRAEKQLQVTEKLAATGRLAATIAHEINNPLTAAMNAIFVAKAVPGVPADFAKFLELADKELRRVAHIARTTLGFYRDTSTPSTINMEEAVQDVLTLLERRIASRRIRVEMRVRGVPVIRGSAVEVRQVLSNLISNSTDAMLQGGVLKIGITPSKNWANACSGVRVTISDTGDGIPLQHRKHIFEPFYTTKQDTGTGLGLWISQSIVERHGGTITLRTSTRAGHSGTVFSVVFPAKQSASSPPTITKSRPA